MFLKDDWKSVLASSTINQIVISQAGHGFSENDTLEEVCEHIGDFVKYINNKK